MSVIILNIIIQRQNRVGLYGALIDSISVTAGAVAKIIQLFCLRQRVVWYKMPKLG
jgi:hypothetical protein